MIIPPWAYAAAAAVTFAAGFGTAWKVQGWRCDADKAEAIAEADRLRAANQAMADRLSASYEQEKQDADVADHGREVQIRTIYRDRPVSADCAVPDSVRSVLEKAVASANSRATGQSGE